MSSEQWGNGSCHECGYNPCRCWANGGCERAEEVAETLRERANIVAAPQAQPTPAWRADIARIREELAQSERAFSHRAEAYAALTRLAEHIARIEQQQTVPQLTDTAHPTHSGKDYNSGEFGDDRGGDRDE